MKLPNFLIFAELDSLRARMGILPDVYGNLQNKIRFTVLTPRELDDLTSQSGLEIRSLDDVRVLPDGTLAYKNSRVLLYIRDHSVYSGRSIDPKFHIANCDTLREMKRQSRHARYVVATRTDGVFKLNIIDGSRKSETLRKLNVCRNCLSMLSYDGFTITLPKRARNKIVDAFSIDGFFLKFPRDLHEIKPEHDSNSAPVNDYNQDFSARSNALRNAASWTCQNQGCRIYLGNHPHRRYLHVHHINGLKSDDAPGNHKVLCIKCHAKEPSHGHMKSMPAYKAFVALNLE